MHRSPARLAHAHAHAVHAGLTLVLALALALAPAADAALAAAPPLARIEPVSDTLHGVRVADPYRHLEDLQSPETRTWLAAQGAYSADVLARIDGRDAMVARIRALADAAGDVVGGVLRMPGERVYFLRRKVGENQMKLVLRTGRNGSERGRERVLVDPDALTRTTGVPHALNYFVPSWDGRSLAYGLSAGGSEDASLHVIDIASGKPLGAPIPRVHEALVHWTPDSRALTFNQVRALPSGTPRTETYLDTTVFVWAPRTPKAAPQPLFSRSLNPNLQLDRLDVAEVIFAADSRFMVARTTDITVPEGRLFVAPLAALTPATSTRRHRSIPWRALASAADKITQVELRGATLYLRTLAGAPRGRVLALDLNLAAAPAAPTVPPLAAAIEVVAEPDAGVLGDFVLGRDALYAQVQQGFNVRAQRFDGTKPSPGVDAAPLLPGSTYVTDDAAAAYPDVWLRTSTWTDPARLLAVNPATPDATPRDTGLLTATRPPGMPELEVSELMVSSHDGARVPLAVLRRKGLALDGRNPTLLIGYGAYGLSIQAGFDARSVAWLERGGVLAFANVRGSGALGDAWHRAGFKTSKPNTWKDGLACARYLIDAGFASARTLGIWGTSAGGIFVGRAVTSAPELFAAAIFDVGMLDTVRSETSANGITNVSEFGSVTDPAEFAALLEMSTYHQIRDATVYPAVLLIHGLNDPRVDVWHSAKTAARLQAVAAAASSPRAKPVLLRLDAQAGHGIGSTAEQAYAKQADIYCFLLWQFGKVGGRP